MIATVPPPWYTVPMIRITCESCSATLELHGGTLRAKAVCPSCGSLLRAPREGAPVQFPAFTEGKWFRCPQCSAETFFDPRLSPTACSFCGSAKLLSVPDLFGNFEEHYYIPFQISPDGARSRVQRLLGSYLWLPAEVRTQLRSAPPVPHYLPTHQLSCSVRSSRFRPGEEPADEEQVQEPQVDELTPLEDGPDATMTSQLPAPRTRASVAKNIASPPSRTSSVSRRWRELMSYLAPRDAGAAEEEAHAGYYNERVPDSRGCTPEHLRHLLPYNYRALRPFRPHCLGPARLERPAEGEDACWEKATERVCDTEMRLFESRRKASADSEEQQLRIVIIDRKARLVILPVYVIGYHYQGRYHRLFVNGQTGKLLEVAHVSPARLAAIAGGFSLAIFLLVLALLAGDLGQFEADRAAAERRMELLGAIPIHLQVSPNATFGSLISEREIAAADAGRIIKRTWTLGQDPLGDLVRAGETQLAAGNVDRAREVFQKVIQDWSEDPRAIYRWCRFKLRLGEAADVEPRIEALLARLPAFSPGYEVLADCKRRLGKFPEAVTAFEKADERAAPDPFAPYDAADLCRVFLHDPKRAVALYRRFLESPESGPACDMIRFLQRQIEGKTEGDFADTLYLTGGGSLKGRVLGREGDRIRLELLTGRGSAEIEYDGSKVERIEREPTPVKREFDRAFNEYDRRLLERQGVLEIEDWLALARLCRGMSDLRVKEAGIFFALRVAILEPEHEEANKILDDGGYAVNRARLVRKPVVDRRRRTEDR